MSEHPPFEGPLHLRKHLGPCNEAVAKALRDAVSHTVSTIRSVHCSCRPSSVMKAAGPENKSESSRRMAIQYGKGPSPGEDRRENCRVFSIELNEEAGVIKAFCRRCQKMFILFDQVLYWGMRRKTDAVPETYPYRCSCGGHAFEIGMGFDYYEDAIDENDMGTISVAVRCAACGEISMILDEEAS